MVTIIACQSSKEYEQVLLDELTAKVLQKKNAVFFDCENILSTYFFHKKDIPLIAKNLEIIPVDGIDHLTEQIREIKTLAHFPKIKTIIVSSFDNLLETQIQKGEKRLLLNHIQRILEQLETKHKKEVILLKRNKETIKTEIITRH